MRTPDLRNERGIALVVAVFALVVIGALVAGTVFVGRLELQSSQSAVFAAEAQEAAELRRQDLFERVHDTGSTRSASPTTSTRTEPLSGNLPATMRRATGVSTSRWMTRLSGRAPNTGS